LYRLFFWGFSASFLLFVFVLVYYKPILYASYIGVWTGYIGMAIIVTFIIYGLVQLIVNPSAPPPIQPVIPGVSIPGSGIKVPLIIGWIALFISAVIHEFCHGIVSRAYKIKVTSSGFAFIGPLAAAFVEPDEKQLKKMPAKVQNSIFAAGPFSNIILALLIFLVLTFILTPIIGAVLTPAGFSFSDITKGGPADAAGVQKDVLYTKIDNQTVLTSADFFTALENLTPNTPIMISNDEKNYTIIAGVNPKNASKGYLGVNVMPEYTHLHSWWATLLLWLFNLLNWIFIISLGLGLANLLPLGPVDGGRMFHAASLKLFGKKSGKRVWVMVTFGFIALLVILLFPIIKATLLEIMNFIF